MFRRRRTAGGPTLTVPGFVDLKLIARGVFSTVYRAHQAAMRRTVALKVLDTNLVDQRDLRRFTRECQAVGRLTGHPHVVTVFDADLTPDGMPYIVMEYCDRGSLAARLKIAGPLSLAEALATGAKLAGALQAAHAAEIVHRDVKPQNILVNRHGQPALADFGIAAFARAGTFAATTGALTIDHAPPEVLERNTVTVAGDVYSLASTVCMLLAGQAPYHADPGTPFAEQLLRVLRGPVPDLPRDGIPARVSEVLRRAMAPDPADRPTSALEFAEQLQRVADRAWPASNRSGHRHRRIDWRTRAECGATIRDVAGPTGPGISGRRPRRHRLPCAGPARSHHRRRSTAEFRSRRASDGPPGDSR